MKFKHSGCIGDVIYSLPILKYHGRGDLYLFPDASSVIKDQKIGLKAGLSLGTINQLTPLLLMQPYVNSVHVGKNTDGIDVNIDIFRGRNIEERGNLCEYILAKNNVPFSVAREPWLTCESKQVQPYIFARSTRHRGERFAVRELKYILSKRRKDAVFVGFNHEWQNFKEEVGDIPWYDCKNIYELCCVVNGSQQLIANQSLAMALAIGLGKSYIQEVCMHMPDCIFDRRNGKYIISGKMPPKKAHLIRKEHLYRTIKLS
jgi:hypothetical protein